MCSMSVIVPSGLARRLRLRRRSRRPLDSATRRSVLVSVRPGRVPRPDQVGPGSRTSAGVLLLGGGRGLLLLQLVQLALQFRDLVILGRLGGGGGRCRRRDLLRLDRLGVLVRALVAGEVLGLGLEDLHGFSYGPGRG